MMSGPPCFTISAGMLSTPGDLPSFSIRSALSTSSLGMAESHVSLLSTLSSFFSRYLHQFLICNCTTWCDIRSIVCGLLCLLLRVYSAHFPLVRLCLLSLSQQFYSVESRLAVPCSDSLSIYWHWSLIQFSFACFTFLLITWLTWL